jgi:hypothetical protein
MNAGQFATKFVPVVGGLASGTTAGIDFFDKKAESSAEAGMHNSNVARSLGTTLPAPKGIFFEVYRCSHVDVINQQKEFRRVNRIDQNADSGVTYALSFVLNNVLPSTFATLNYRAGARMVDSFPAQLTSKLPYTCSDRGACTVYDNTLELGELCTVGNPSRCKSGKCERQPIGTTGVHVFTSRSVCTEKDNAFIDESSKSIATEATATALQVLLAYIRKGEFVMDVCIGKDALCQKNDVLRSIPGTTTIIPGGDDAVQVTVDVPRIKLGAIGYVNS